MVSSIEDNRQNQEVPITYFKIELAKKKIEIECNYRSIAYFCRDYLAKFNKPDFIIHISEQDIEIARQKSTHKLFDHDGNAADLSEYYEITIVYQKIAEKMLMYNIIMLHGAAVAIKNKCFVFTAPSGVGKSTHIMNWLNCISGSFVVNGDKPLIDVEKKLVYGTPWCGKEGMNTNTEIPLAGIVYLERGKHNTIAQITFKEMLPMYIQQSFIPQDYKLALKAYQLLDKFQDVPCYRLICNKDKESAIVAYRGLCGNL